jgi:hypothetical protein
VGGFALVLGFLLVIAYPDVLVGVRSFYTRDFSSFGYPLAHYVRQSCRAGELPLWNPYNFAGLPFLAQWNTLCLYPFSLIYILLPLPWSLNLFNLFHVFLGGLGLFRLAGRWFGESRAAAIAGIAYAFSGLMLSALMWPNNIAALGWLPFVLCAGESAAQGGGRRCLCAALVLAMQFLCGAPEITALTWLGLLVLVLWAQEPGGARFPTRLTRLLRVFAVTVGLIAIQLVPFFELLQHSHRDPRYGSADWHLSWAGLGNFLVPLFRTVQDRDDIFFQASQQWITNHYGGASVMLLAALGVWSGRNRRVRVLIAGALGSLVLAMGHETIAYNWLRGAVPLLGLMRYPIKFIVPALVVLPMLAGRGARMLFEGELAAGTLHKAASLLTAALFVLIGLTWWHPAPGEDTKATLFSASLSLLFLLGMWLLAGWARRARAGGLRWLLPLAMGIVVFSDLFLAHRRQNPTVPASVMLRSYATAEPRPVLGEGRVMVASAAHRLLDSTVFSGPEPAVRIPRQALLLDANLLEGIPKLDGFFSLYLPRPASLIARVSQQTNNAAHGLLDFLGVTLVNRADKPWQWDRRTTSLPLLTLVPQAVFLDDTNAVEYLLSDRFNPRAEVVLPSELGARLQVTGRGSGAILTRLVSRHRVVASVQVSEPLFLVLAQADYPGWIAQMDNMRVQILRANYAFQAVAVPAGHHVVVVEYRPRSFELGLWISLLTLGASWWAWGRSRPSPDA